MNRLVCPINPYGDVHAFAPEGYCTWCAKQKPASAGNVSAALADMVRGAADPDAVDLLSMTLWNSAKRHYPETEFVRLAGIADFTARVVRDVAARSDINGVDEVGLIAECIFGLVKIKLAKAPRYG